MAKQESLLAIREYAASLNPDERKGFIDKFNSIKDDDTKIDTLASRISGLSQQKPMFSSIEEARIAQEQANKDLQKAQANASPLGFAINHPFLASLQGAPELLTGRSLSDRVRQLKESKTLGQSSQKPFDQNVSNVGNVILAADVGSGLIDSITSPSNLLLNPASKYGAKIVANTVRGAKNIVNDLVTGPARAIEAAKQAKFELSQASMQEAKNISKIGKAKINIQERNQESILKGYDELSDTLKKKSVNLANRETANLQQDLPRIFGKQSSEYGAKLSSIIKDKDIPADKVVTGLEDALIKHGILRQEGESLILARAPLSSAEKEVYSLYQGTRESLSSNPGAVIQANDLLRSQKYIQPKFGRKWSADDRLRGSVAEELSKQLEEVVPGIKELRSEYRPYLQWKNKAIENIDPFAPGGKFDTNKGTKFLSKVGENDLLPADKAFISELEKITGKKISNGKIEALNKGILDISNKKEVLKFSNETQVNKLRQELADKLFELRKNSANKRFNIEKSKDELLRKYLIMRTVAGAIGAGATWLGAKKGIEAFSISNSR